MAGSPKKRARRLAAAAAGKAPRARGRARETPDPELLALLARKSIPPIPPERLPSDARLVQIAKGVLLAVAKHGTPEHQVKAAWQLADLARRSAPAAAADDLETMSDEELIAQSAQAERALGSRVQ